MEPASLAGAPSWMEKPGTGVCEVEEDGRCCRISQPNLRTTVAEGKVRLASSTIATVTPFASSRVGKAVRGFVTAREPHSSFRVIDPQ